MAISKSYVSLPGGKSPEKEDEDNPMGITPLIGLEREHSGNKLMDYDEK